MNEILESIVRRHAPGAVESRLSFVKFNTTGSPSRPMPKVLFFCFFNDERDPRYCIKTVRAPRDNDVIRRGFGHLRALADIDAALFPKPVWMGQEDGVAYSIGSALPGRRVGAADISAVMSAYLHFQKAAALRATRVPGSARLKALLDALHASGQARRFVETILKNVREAPEIVLLPQHGDLTYDNALIARDRVGLVDCDWYMPQGTAGFDVFHFLKRAPQQKRSSAYLREYCDAVGLRRAVTVFDMLLWCLEEYHLKTRQGSAVTDEWLEAEFERARRHFLLA